MIRRVSDILGKSSHIVLIFPYALLFTVFILLPVIAAIALSFTSFDAVQFPNFTGFRNYIVLLTQDPIFMQRVLPNTILFGMVVGVGGYVLAFLLAWSLAQLTPKLRIILAIIIYSPSLTGGVMMTTIWRVLFAGNETGYLNGLLLGWGVIQEPVAWLTATGYIMPIMIIVALWSSMGVGFLAMLAGVLNVNEEELDASKIDGVRNRFQELVYIIIPSMKPQMLFGAVMAIVGTFQNGAIGVSLTGSNPTPRYAGQLITNHMDDYGFIRFEMGYASAISVLLLLIAFGITMFARRLFSDDD